MATETESWECVEECTPRSESEDSCGIIVSYSASRSASRLGSRGSNGRSRGSHPDRLYINMAERMEQRKQRRQELEMRYECARKQQEEEKRVKEELKLTLEKLQRKATAEQNRAAQRRQKQLEREAQQRRELFRQQRELASLHSFRRVLLHFGLRPWYRFLVQCRRNVKTAELNYDHFLMKRTLKWLHTRSIEGRSSSKQRARSLALCAQGFQDRWRLRYFWLYWLEGRRGDHLHQQFLLKRACKALREIFEYRRKLDQIGDERNRFRLLSGSWSKWTLHVRKEKSAELLKYLEIEQIASLHWQRVTYVRILKAWKDGMEVVRYEKERTQHKAETWTKIHFWLGEHNENTGKIDKVEPHRSKQ
ncbi:hypothetical protein M758_7G135300 [Ceratodon purpureus]|nr:hypothetical protein M758_7G135300 [Ceratodon purpureus]